MRLSNKPSKGIDLTLAPVPNGKSLIVSCCGNDDLRGDIAAAPVPWWSITKTCLAACALVLVARGRLALDEPLPARPYTLRHLLQHTSGLGSYTARPEYHAAIERNEVPWTDSAVSARVRLDPFLFNPGEGWSYSNTGYFLVRRLIEQTAGAEIDAALRTLVLSPLGLQSARIARTRADLDDCADGNAAGYHPAWVFHGLLIGPLTEAALFMHRLLASDFLPGNLRAAMHQCRRLDVPLSGRPWQSTGYGLGLMINTVSRLGAAVGHTGQGPNSVAAAYHFPSVDQPHTVAAFASGRDQGVVEHAAVNAAAPAVGTRDTSGMT